LLTEITEEGITRAMSTTAVSMPSPKNLSDCQLSKLSVAKLKAHCKEKGLRGYSNLCKPALVDMLRKEEICND